MLHTLDWLNTGSITQFAYWRGLKRIPMPMLIILLAVRSVSWCSLNVFSLFAIWLLQNYSFLLIPSRFPPALPCESHVSVGNQWNPRGNQLKGYMAGLAVAPATFSSILSWRNSMLMGQKLYQDAQEPALIILRASRPHCSFQSLDGLFMSMFSQGPKGGWTHGCTWTSLSSKDLGSTRTPIPCLPISLATCL
jgi:hypothetical protein